VKVGKILYRKTPLEREANRAAAKVVEIKSSIEEFVKDMGQSENYAVAKDAQNMLFQEEFV